MGVSFNAPQDPKTKATMRVNVSGSDLAKWEEKAQEYFKSKAGKEANTDEGRLFY